MSWRCLSALAKGVGRWSEGNGRREEPTLRPSPSNAVDPALPPPFASSTCGYGHGLRRTAEDTARAAAAGRNRSGDGEASPAVRPRPGRRACLPSVSIDRVSLSRHPRDGCSSSLILLDLQRGDGRPQARHPCPPHLGGEGRHPVIHLGRAGSSARQAGGWRDGGSG